MFIFKIIFLCARRRRLGDPKSFQHTLRGEQQVRDKNLELQTCFVFKSLSLQKFELKLGFDFKKTWAWIQTWVWIFGWWWIGQKKEQKRNYAWAQVQRWSSAHAQLHFWKKKKELNSSSDLFLFAWFEFFSTLKKTWMGKKQMSSLGWAPNW